MLREQDANFELFGGPRSLALVQACAGAQFVLIGTRVDRRTGPRRRVRVELVGRHRLRAPRRRPGPARRARRAGRAPRAWPPGTDGSFVAVGDRFATTGTDATTHAAAWWTADPAAWTRATVPFDDVGGRTSMTAVAAGPDGLLAGGTRTRDGVTVLCVWSSADGVGVAVPADRGAVDHGDEHGVGGDGAGPRRHGVVARRSARHRARCSPGRPTAVTWYRRPLPADSPASAQVRVALTAPRRPAAGRRRRPVDRGHASSVRADAPSGCTGRRLLTAGTVRRGHGPRPYAARLMSTPIEQSTQVVPQPSLHGGLTDGHVRAPAHPPRPLGRRRARHARVRRPAAARASARPRRNASPNACAASRSTRSPARTWPGPARPPRRWPRHAGSTVEEFVDLEEVRLGDWSRRRVPPARRRGATPSSSPGRRPGGGTGSPAARATTRSAARVTRGDRRSWPPTTAARRWPWSATAGSSAPTWRAVLGIERTLWLAVENTSVTVVHLGPHGAFVVAANDCHHLYDPAFGPG